MGANSQERVWMIVEDEPGVRDALTQMFMLWGVRTLVFPDGESALAWIDKLEMGQAVGPIPELALLDLRLLPTGAQGFDVAARLRQSPHTARTGIVIVTASQLDEREREGIERAVQPDLFIGKPFPELRKFQQLLEGVVQARRVG